MSPETFARYLEIARAHGVESARIVVEGASCEFTLMASAAPPPGKPGEEFRAVEDALREPSDDLLYGSAG